MAENRDELLAISAGDIKIAAGVLLTGVSVGGSIVISIGSGGTLVIPASSITTVAVSAGQALIVSGTATIVITTA